MKSSRIKSILIPAMLVAVTISFSRSAMAGHIFGRGQSIGGISIDVQGVVANAKPEAVKMFLTAMRKEFREAPKEMGAPTELRMVSLKALEKACAEALANNLAQLPEEIRYMGGLQQIQYVFVYPEENDIVLAGPAEGWKLDDRGYVVGVTTGRPLLQLDDFIVALRSSELARTEGISCSIDPTEEGNRRLMELLGRYSANRTVPPENEIKNAFGPQQVAITGVSPTTHFARVLVAADFRMKCLAMEVEQKQPLRELPSYISIAKQKGLGKNNSPRWWLASDYEPCAKSEDSLTWEIRGRSVKALTEDEFVDATGKSVRTGKTSPAAARWAELMTKHYDALCSKEPIFGELKNLMDLSVVAAIVHKERLLDRAGMQLPILVGDSQLKPDKWNSPKTVPPQVSFSKASGGVIVTASGGVQIASWEVADRVVVDEKITKARGDVTRKRSSENFWWQ